MEEAWVVLAVVSKTLLLRPADRTHVQQKIRWNGRWGTKLFKIRDAREACIRRFGSYGGWKNAVSSQHQRGAKKAASAKRKRDARTEILKSKLRSRGCELRSDSRLCDAFIDKGEGDPETISIIMEEMKFYHDHTDYEQIRSEE
jgi:hypothetical protein